MEGKETHLDKQSIGMLQKLFILQYLHWFHVGWILMIVLVTA